MKTKIIFISIAIILFFSMIGSASYEGDNLEIYAHEMIKGDLIFTIGDSRYSGEIPSGSTYDVNFDASMPDGASVKSARLYIYWIWSHSGNEGIIPSLETRFQDSLLVTDREYTDRKGSGSYDYPCGTYAYDVTSIISDDGEYLATVKNTGDDKTFAINGIGLLVIYEYGEQEIEYWISEGADMIYATEDIDSNDAVTEVVFENLNSPDTVDNAILTTVIPGGNKGKNSLYFNSESWDGVYNGEPSNDLAIDKRDVKDFLQSINIVKIVDDGDYMQPSNAILAVKYPSSEDKADNQMLGFELIAAVGMLAMAYRFIGHRDNDE